VFEVLGARIGNSVSACSRVRKGVILAVVLLLVAVDGICGEWGTETGDATVVGFEWAGRFAATRVAETRHGAAAAAAGREVSAPPFRCQ
jgi:hypothetical protein